MGASYCDVGDRRGSAGKALHCIIRMMICANVIIIIIMIEEERHALNFEGDYNEFHVALILSPETESFTVRVENSLTHARYQQDIDPAYL
jgi:hypothetical protein